MAQGAAYRPRLGARDQQERRDGVGLRRLRLLVGLVAAALVVEALLIPFRSPRFAVREVELRGDPRVTELVAARMGLPANTSFLLAPTGLLERRAEGVPAVERAVAGRRLPNRLVVTVERREAVAVIRRAEEALLVNPEGVVFSIRDDWGWGLPELVGKNLTKEKVGTAAGRRELGELLGVLRALGPDPRLRVTRLEVAPGGEIEGELESGAKVRLGRGDQLEVKIKLLAATLDQLGADRIGYVDLRDPRATYWRPRKARTAAREAR